MTKSRKGKITAEAFDRIRVAEARRIVDRCEAARTRWLRFADPSIQGRDADEAMENFLGALNRLEGELTAWRRRQVADIKSGR